MFVHRKQGLFLSVYVDAIRMAGNMQNMAPMWKKMMKNVDIDEPTSFFHHVYLERATETLPGWQKLHAQTVAWSHDMEGDAQKCVERHCEIGKQESGAIVQSFKSLLGCPSIQAGRA